MIALLLVLRLPEPKSVDPPPAIRANRRQLATDRPIVFEKQELARIEKEEPTRTIIVELFKNTQA